MAGGPEGPVRLHPEPSKNVNFPLIAVIGVLAVIVLSAESVAAFYGEYLWFLEMAQGSVFRTVIFTRVGMGLLVGLGACLMILANTLVARRSAPHFAITWNEEIIQLDLKRVERYMIWVVVAGALVVGFGYGVTAAARWTTWARYVHQVPFNLTDPIFHRDVAFYMFTLPLVRLIQAWVSSILVLSAVAAGVVYALLGSFRVENRKFSLMPQPAIHLSALAGLFFLTLAWRYWIDAYDILFSTRGAVFGAGYTDVHAQLPAVRILAVVSAGVAVGCFANVVRRGWRLPVFGAALVIVTSVVVGGIYPSIIQTYRVKANEDVLEAPYIGRDIKYTRLAYDLETIDARHFPARFDLSAAKVADNSATVNNVRLWDWRPLQRTYGQLQELRLYYRFADVDVDRYRIRGDLRQMSVATRELDIAKLPERARTWVNEHLFYSHGHGIVMSPVNRVTEEGQPELWIKDIPPRSREGLKVARPEIYFGELTDQYVIVNTKTREFDYARGDKNVYTRYHGRAGVRLDSTGRKLAFALKFGDMKFLLSDAITPDSRLLFHRNVVERLRTLAPFLTYDRDPYMVLSGGRLYWMVDAYTVGAYYPYSQPFGGNLNYIRNSVKAVVDAYDGTATFYVVDRKDPVIRTYARIFPTLFAPFSKMPEGLRQHIRYPVDLFTIQAGMYATYHMTDPKVFYNKEDQWDVAKESQGGTEQGMQPYYVVMKIPGDHKAEYVLMLPFTPSNRNNMIAWMAARSDPDRYGQRIVFKLPKEKLIYGPTQVEARVDQEPRISEQLTLWNQRGSSVIRGNLLVIPVENSLLYVQPLYLEAVQSQLPELKRVIVTYKDKIAMETTLARALAVVFGVAPPAEGPATSEGRPSKTPVGAAALVKEAVRRFEAGQKLLRSGDLAGYAREMEAVGRLLKQMEAAGKK